MPLKGISADVMSFFTTEKIQKVGKESRNTIY